MIRTLFIIAGAALVLCLVSLGGAAALAGRDLKEHDWTWVVSEDETGDDSLRFERGEVSPDAVRTLAWTGGDTLSLDLPVDVTYVQGDKAGVTVSGPQTTIDRVRLVDGRLTLQDGDREERGYVTLGRNGLRAWSETERLRITVTAPSVNSFRVGGSGDLTIEGYDKPAIELLIDGSGDVEASGKAQALKLRVNGSGDADLEDLTLADAAIDMQGSGDVSAGPTGVVEADLAGSGDLRLTRRPERLVRNLSGSGDVIGE